LLACAEPTAAHGGVFQLGDAAACFVQLILQALSASCLVLCSLVSLLGEQACDLLGAFGGNEPINQRGDI
jgi:hypothetical protein